MMVSKSFRGLINICSSLALASAFTGCGTGVTVSSNEVSKDEFYVSLSSTYNQAKDEMSWIASFKRSSLNGDAVRLDSPARIKVNERSMEATDPRQFAALGLLLPFPFLMFSMQGIFYSAHTAGIHESHFQFVAPDGSIENFHLPAPRAVATRNMAMKEFSIRNDLIVETDFAAADGNDNLRCSVRFSLAKDPKSSTTESSSTVKGNQCIIDKSEMAKANPGEAEIILERSYTSRPRSKLSGYQSTEFVSFPVKIVLKP